MRACVVHGAGDLRVDTFGVGLPGLGEIAVAVALGGICGSDLHYYQRGAVGDFAIREPLILGHEVVGTVAALGSDVNGPAIGVAVAVHPATPCGTCLECTHGRRNLCSQVRYLGSAARVPHVQGGFAECIVVRAEQIRTLPPGLPLRQAVLTEPLSVALHAVGRAGEVAGKRVLVTGAGPIGCLVVAALRHAGAAEIVVSDIAPEPLSLATLIGATSVVQAPEHGGGIPGELDIAIEASGSATGLGTCIRSTRRGGTVVALGLLPTGDAPFPGNIVVTRELDVRGAFRFDTEFDLAITLLADGLYVQPIITHSFPLENATTAFATAANRRVASKVLLEFGADR